MENKSNNPISTTLPLKDLSVLFFDGGEIVLETVVFASELAWQKAAESAKVNVFDCEGDIGAVDCILPLRSCRQPIIVEVDTEINGHMTRRLSIGPLASVVCENHEKMNITVFDPRI
jgi:hypothetical protein